MLDNLNFWEIAALALLGLFIFGPERLPKVISDGLRMLRNLRDMARNATADLSRELGTEVKLEDLNPKTFVRKHLLSEEEERALRRPFDDVYGDVKRIASDANDGVADIASDANDVAASRPRQQYPTGSANGNVPAPYRGPSDAPARAYDQAPASRYDADARYDADPRYDSDAT